MPESDQAQATPEPRLVSIPLTDSAPVEIDEGDWTLIAEAGRLSGENWPNSNQVAELSVREHEDGRRIVSGLVERAGGGEVSGWYPAYSGFILTPSQNTVAAIRRVADDLEEQTVVRVNMGSLVAECIRALPRRRLQ